MQGCYTQAPEVLIFTISRGGIRGGMKDHRRVKAPVDANLTIHLSDGSLKRYRLHSAIEHVGERADSGHYLAKVRVDERWLTFNDAEPVDACIDPLERDVVTLFYVATDLTDQPEPRESLSLRQQLVDTSPVPSTHDTTRIRNRRNGRSLRVATINEGKNSSCSLAVLSDWAQQHKLDVIFVSEAAIRSKDVRLDGSVYHGEVIPTGTSLKGGAGFLMKQTRMYAEVIPTHLTGQDRLWSICYFTDPQRRLFVSVYATPELTAESEAFHDLLAQLTLLCRRSARVIVGGDFNCATEELERLSKRRLLDAVLADQGLTLRTTKPSYQEYPTSSFSDLDLLWTKGLDASMLYREPPEHRYNEKDHRYLKNVKHCRMLYTFHGLERNHGAPLTRGWRWDRLREDTDLQTAYAERVDALLLSGAKHLSHAIMQAATSLVGAKLRFPGLRMRARQRRTIRQLTKTVNLKRTL